MSEDESDVLGLLIRHELAIRELYEAFAVLFKDYEEFWKSIAADEQRHADLLSKLRSEPVAGRWLLLDGRLKPQAIKTSIGYVEDQTAKAREGNYNLLQALSTARDIESALLERQFSKLKDSPPKEIESVLTNLTNETERHLKIVIDAFSAEKRKKT